MTISASTSSAVSAPRSPGGTRPGPADATMSTGLPTLASGGRNARRARSRVAAENGDTVRPAASHASTARMPGSAGVGDDRDAAAGGQRLRVEARRDVEHLVDRVGADDAGLVEQRVDGDVAGGQRRGVAAGRARPGARASGLHRDDRLVPRRCAARAARTAAGSRTTRGTAG